MDCRLPIWIFILLNFALSPTLFANGDEGGGKAEPEEWNVINGTVKRNYTLTGIPQIDYVHDPNLPRELNGYNLSSYPFFGRVPKNINFSCDSLKDGFYASVEHSCQVYHHCLFGTRYDFLCANYTAFDQRTFICQFVSEVDCPNSANFFHRNDALYQSPSTTTVAPVVIYVGPSGRRIRPSPLLTVKEEAKKPSKPPDEERITKDEEDFRDYPNPPVRERPFPRRRNRRRCGPGRRRRCRRPRPRPDYYDYYDYEDDYDSDRRNKPKVRNRDREYDYEDYEAEGTVDDFEKLGPASKKRNKVKDDEFESRLGASTRSPVSKAKAVAMSPPLVTSAPTVAEVATDPYSVATNREKIFSKSRAPPKIRPPVPRHEKSKYGSIQGRFEDLITSTTSTTTTKAPPTTTPPRTAPPTQTPPPLPEYEEYYDDELEPPTTYRNNGLGYLPTPIPPSTARSTSTTTVSTTPPPPPPSIAAQYEYEYEEYEDEATTTLKPEPVPVTSTVRNTLGPRRFHAQQRQESISVEDRRRPPGVEHQRINEALEAPSKASLRIPYHNKPRPSFVRNAQMLLPVTTERSSTTAAVTQPVRPSFDEHYDGLNRRFPVFDTESKLPLESVAEAAERQRKRFRAMEATTPESISDEYMGFEEIEPHEATERYGHQYTQAHDETARRSSPYPLVKPHFNFNDNAPAKFEVFDPPSKPQQHSRAMTFDLPHVNNPPKARPSNVNRPEYISLLSDDEQEPASAFVQNQGHHSRSRFTQGRARGFLNSAQEQYPSYVPMPQSFAYADHYVRQRGLEGIRRRRHGVEPYYRQRSRPFYSG